MLPARPLAFRAVGLAATLWLLGCQGAPAAVSLAAAPKPAFSLAPLLPSPARSASPTPTPSASPTASPSASPTPTAVPSASPSASPTPTAAPSASPSPVPAGLIVPLYIYPTDPAWKTLEAIQKAHPSVPIRAIANPASGPGEAANADYVSAIRTLRASGVVPLGYVATGYAKRSLAAIKSDVDRWKRFYPETRGIFFDEMANTPGHEDFYRQLDAYARAQGFGVTVGNPGADTQESYADTLDTILIYENAGLPDAAALAGGWHAKVSRARFGLIPHSVASLSATSVKPLLSAAAWLYVTDDVMPNPWDTLPPYLDTLAGLLEGQTAAYRLKR